ncbi:GntR family transcriptional regulator [Brenneria goodwinii]|uniref:GntR family transcriptional regulator n=1 Tax=Brenneria goodwinii TaxID=1109412 RepID=A0A0G4JQB7_9GAMM|nr:FCD domain-containing protein [Brenneria goodwinii]ATA24988.1 transcriptional regulator [Brenneria goodwinii]MCG8155543.1 FCD domain-containing protein [Brenneria goodwinii]MCG8160430.1 FCD domain-containing protein [Brenneria goodwinii]MCG8164953.1 FCD domain-containing protein [Brenneria goodwinii]MCG8169390.1 FCD domain-containing protein [Brenneria goodwinii]
MRLYQQIGGNIRAEILNGKYQIGDRLSPERDIADAYGVSRSVVREALIMLELEKLIEVRKGSGVYVIQIPEGPEKGEAADSGYGPFELLQARQLLESEVAAFAAMQATKSDIIKMRQAIEQETLSLENGSVDESADEQFHCLLAQSTQNSVLANMVYEVWQARKRSPMWQGIHSHTDDFSYQRQWLDDHQKILRAVSRRDSKMARQEMWLHLENVKNKLLEISNMDDPAFDGYLFESVPSRLEY